MIKATKMVFLLEVQHIFTNFAASMIKNVCCFLKLTIMKKKFLLFKTLLAFVMLTGFGVQHTLAADHKIVVIADPHVMPASLLTNPSNSDWATYIGSSRKLIDFSQSLFDQAVAEIKTLKPDLVLIVGDLTKDGEKDSHVYVKGKLKELKDAGIQPLVILGNHDWGTTDAKVYGATTTDALIYDKSQLKDFYADYGFGSSETESTTLTYACEPIPGLVVIGIDSGKDGVVSATTLDWVKTKAAAAKAAGKQVIAMMHHPLIPHITGGDEFVATSHVLYPNSSDTGDGYKTVRNTLADAGVELIFTGHFHTSDIARDWNADLSKDIYDVNTGALCSYPCDYRIVTLNDAMSSISVTTKSITTAGNSLIGETFGPATAKTRLTKYLTAIITAKLTAMLGSVLASMVAPNLVNAYIYHADGDENANSEAQDVLGKLTPYFSLSPQYSALANSLLLDLSNYGDADRQNQTNDRTLAFLANDDDNTAALTAIKDKANATIVLSERTINKDGKFKSVCLPFALSDLSASPLAGFSGLKELDVVNAVGGHVSGVDGSTLYLNFADASAIEAGKPYLISWAAATALTNPVFTNVTATSTTPTPVSFTGGKFVGSYSPFEITNALLDKVIYLGSNNTIGYAKAARTLQTMRAHFELNSSSAPSQTVVNFGDDMTGIWNVNVNDNVNDNDNWCDLNGRKLGKKPTQKGVYIQNGRKFVVK